MVFTCSDSTLEIGGKGAYQVPGWFEDERFTRARNRRFLAAFNLSKGSASFAADELRLCTTVDELLEGGDCVARLGAKTAKTFCGENAHSLLAMFEHLEQVRQRANADLPKCFQNELTIFIPLQRSGQSRCRVLRFLAELRER